MNLIIETPQNENKKKIVCATEPINRIIGQISPINSLNKLSQRGLHKFTKVCASSISLDFQSKRRFEISQNQKEILEFEVNNESNETNKDSEFKLKFKLSKGNYFGDIALIKDDLS